METASGDRRKHKRYKIRGGAFLVRADQLGRIDDISMGGLGMQYICTGPPLTGSFTVDIFMSNSAFHLNRIPVDAVSDHPATDPTCTDPSSMRRCGMRFSELTPENETLMKRFIEVNRVADH